MSIVFVVLCAVVAPLAFANDTVHVEVVGLDDTLRDNVLKFLSIERLAKRDSGGVLKQIFKGDDDAGAGAQKIDGAQIRRAHRQAPEQIRQALQPFGYYSPKIDASLAHKDDVFTARYEVDRGVATTLLTPIDIEVAGPGRNNPEIVRVIATIREDPQSLAGAVLKHAHYESSKSALLDSAYNHGFVDAHYTESVIRVDRSQRTADIVLRLDTGRRYVFGEISVDQDEIRPEIIDHYITIKPGDTFRPQRLTEVQFELENSGYFDAVDVQPNKSAAQDGRVPVTVTTQFSKPRHYSAALGFGTDTGPRIKLSADFRRINSLGHKIKTDARASALGFAVSGQYEVPSVGSKDDRWVYDIHAINDDVVDQETRQYALGASRFDAWRGFARRLYTTYSQEDFDIGSVTSASTLLVAGASLRRHSSDTPIVTEHGYSVLFDVHGGVDSLGSDTTFAQASMRLRGVYAVGSKTRVLGHLSYGLTSADDFDALPLGQRFFAGGDRSVRGYKYQSLTPRDADGNALGARYTVAAGVELERMLRGNYGVAAFVDTGNASNDSLPSLKTGVGIGARYRAPIGMVRVDVAHPLEDEGRDYRLHISIGGDL